MSNGRQIRLDSNETREVRLDVHSEGITSVEVTSQGFLRIPASITRTGVLEYRRADGTTVRELRHPDEVLKEDSLATLIGAPVTIDHPGMVTPENVSSHSAGHVGEKITPNGHLVDGTLTVQRKDAIDGVQSKKLKEISPGYTCRIDCTPGTYEGEHYDQAQTDIVYNHVALGAVGWGRSGPEVALRMDAAISGITNEPIDPEGDSKEILPMKKIRFTLDGHTYELEIPEALAPTFEASINKLDKERADAADAGAKAEGALAVATKKAEDTQARLDAATSPEAVEKIVSERVLVIEKAKKMAPELKMDGLTVDQIRTEALVASGFKRETFDGKSAGYIEGAFEAADADAKAPEGDDFPGGPSLHQDKKDVQKKQDKKDDNPEAARQRMTERSQNAWQSETNK